MDELPRLAISDIPAENKGATWLIWRGAAVRVTRMPQNLGGTALRLICSRCNRNCTVIYFSGAPCCYRCTGARYRTHSESPSRRALRAAEKIFARNKVDTSRKGWKPKWMRWPTFERLQAAAEEAFQIIEAAENAPYALLERMERKRGRPPKAS